MHEVFAASTNLMLPPCPRKWQYRLAQFVGYASVLFAASAFVPGCMHDAMALTGVALVECLLPRGVAGAVHFLCSCAQVPRIRSIRPAASIRPQGEPSAC
jgi:hypothetical protein